MFSRNASATPLTNYSEDPASATRKRQRAADESDLEGSVARKRPAMSRRPSGKQMVVELPKLADALKKLDKVRGGTLV